MSTAQRVPPVSAPKGPGSASQPQTRWQRFWRRYSPYGELPRSSAASLGFHLFLLLLIMLMSGVFTRPDHDPPSVVSITVGPDPEAAPDEGETSGGEEGAMEKTESSADTPVAETTPSDETPNDVTPDEVKAAKVSDAGEQQAITKDAVKKADAAAAAAAAAMDAAIKKIKENMNKGDGGGSGAGATGRAARPARWVLVYRYTSTQDYLAQMEGLGAKVAFPANGGQFRYFSNLTAAKPKSELRDLANENRLYWLDESRESAGAVAAALGAGNASSFLSFLPLALEERMLKLELAFKGLRENRIRSTRFVVVNRGGGYDVEVESQIAN